MSLLMLEGRVSLDVFLPEELDVRECAYHVLGYQLT